MRPPWCLKNWDGSKKCNFSLAGFRRWGSGRFRDKWLSIWASNGMEHSTNSCCFYKQKKKRAYSRIKGSHSQLAVWIFFFDCFREYPLSNFRRYSRKQPNDKSAAGPFLQISAKAPRFFTICSYFDGKWPLPRAPPLKICFSTLFQIFEGDS